MRQSELALFAWMSAGSSPTPWLLAFMSALAQNGPWLSVAILATIAWRKPSERIYLLATLATCGVASVLAHALAKAIDLPRPFMLGLSPDYIAHGARGAMPSAHATVMFTMAFALMFRRGLRSWGLAAAVVAAGTGFARVFIGVHFPFDIVAGLLLGALIGAALHIVVALGRRAWTRLRPPNASAVTPGAEGPRL
jgi:membrane-associated phospholipid phosphatase